VPAYAEGGRLVEVMAPQKVFIQSFLGFFCAKEPERAQTRHQLNIEEVVMKKFSLLTLLALGIFGLILTVLPTDALAIHKGAGDLTCGACHTMHNSQGGVDLEGAAGGSLVLLRGVVTGREDIHNFCLNCHASDGSQAGDTHSPHSETAPKVLLANAVGGGSTWVESSFLNVIGAGGDFQDACGDVSAGVWDCVTTDGAVSQGKGHSLGQTAVTPPGAADGAVAAFSCTACHDPHGTDNAASTSINKFRILKFAPANSGDSIELTDADHTSWVGGITGLFGAGGDNYDPVDKDTGVLFGAGTGQEVDGIWPIYSGNTALNAVPAAADAARSNSYGLGNTGGMSKWCATCHDNWHDGVGNSPANDAGGGDWNRHPVDNTLTGDGTTTSGAGVTVIDTTNYDVTTAGQALPVALPAAAAQRVWYLNKGVSENVDSVFCLSCHFAHGGPYFDNLRWDYLSVVGAGSQTANPIASTTGCQLCHNRGG
jgi:cytochrome c553